MDDWLNEAQLAPWIWINFGTSFLGIGTRPKGLEHTGDYIQQICRGTYLAASSVTWLGSARDANLTCCPLVHNRVSLTRVCSPGWFHRPSLHAQRDQSTLVIISSTYAEEPTQQHRQQHDLDQLGMPIGHVVPWCITEWALLRPHSGMLSRMVP